jgi:copper transport protein
MLHLAAVAVWLGGLVMLAAVLLPRRRPEELADIVPRFSRLAFGSVSTEAVAGTVMLVLLSPQWGDLPGALYGRYLGAKLLLVVVLIAVASRSRAFVQRRLPTLATGGSPVEELVPVGAGARSFDPTEPESPQTPGGLASGGDPVDEAALRPFVTAVTAEIAIAAGILAATALLVSRSIPM